MAEEKAAENSAEKEKEEKEHSLMVKAVAGVFATIIAPVAVAFGIKYSDVIINTLTSKPEPAKVEATPAKEKESGATASSASAKTETISTPSEATKTGAAKTEIAKADSSTSSAPKVKGQLKDAKAAAKTAVQNELSYQPVGKVVRLFNELDLSGFYPYLDAQDSGKKAPGKGKDPDKIFTVKRRQIQVSGKYWGALQTEKRYENYLLTVEYKWGEATWGGREKNARQSGILLHCYGPDNAYNGYSPVTIKCQITEGGTGDLVCYSQEPDHKVSISANALKNSWLEGKKQKVMFTYQPTEPLTTLSFGFVRRLGNGDDWKDVKGFHRDGDIELSNTSWNKLECICLGDHIWIRLNGKLVNVATEVRPAIGRIGLQSHGAEIFFRKVELQPITKKS